MKLDLGLTPYSAGYRLLQFVEVAFKEMAGAPDDMLQLTQFKIGTGTYRVRISGALVVAEHSPG